MPQNTMKQPTSPNTSIAPQTGPHSTQTTSETVYELEVMFPFEKDWAPVTALTDDREPLRTPEQAWAFWDEVASSSDLYRSAQARLVSVTRRVMGPAAEPVAGWEQYHRHMALVAAEGRITTG